MKEQNNTIRVLLINILIILVGIVFWRGCLNNFFAQDSFLFLIHAKTLIHSWSEFLTALFRVGAVDNDYVPITHTLYFTVMQKVFGTEAYYYHLSRLIIHILNAIIIFWIIRLLFEKDYLGVIGSVLYITRSVSYVPLHWSVLMQDLAGLFFCGLFILLYILYLKKDSKKWLYLSILFYVLAFFSREIAIMIAGSIVPLFLYITHEQNRLSYGKLIAHLMLFLITGGLIYGFHFYISSGYESVIYFDTLHMDRFLQFLNWTLYGKIRIAPFLKFFLTISFLLLTISPIISWLQNEKRENYAPAFTPLFFLITGFLLAVPALVIKERLAQYYAFFLSFFMILAFASVIHYFMQRLTSKQHKAVVYSAVILLLILSSFMEYNIIQRRGDRSYIKQNGTIKEKNYDVYAPNPRWEWTGGWLNSNFALKTKLFYKEIKSAFPQGFPKSSKIVLVGWEEIFTSGNPLAHSLKLELVSTTETMLRLFFDDNSLTTKFVPFKYSTYNPVTKSYNIEIEELKEFLSSDKENVFILYINPVEGNIEKYYKADTMEAEAVTEDIDAYYKRFHLIENVLYKEVI